MLAYFYLLPKSRFHHLFLRNVLYSVFVKNLWVCLLGPSNIKKRGLHTFSIVSGCGLLAAVRFGIMLQTSGFSKKLICGAENTNTCTVAKAGHADLRLFSLLRGKMFSACGLERVPPVREFKLVGVVGHHCNQM